MVDKCTPINSKLSGAKCMTCTLYYIALPCLPALEVEEVFGAVGTVY